MNSHSPTPTSGHGRTSRKPAKGSGRLPYMSERQTEAYLLARDALTRFQRTSSLVSVPCSFCLTRSPWTPRTLRRVSTTAWGSSARPMAVVPTG